MNYSAPSNFKIREFVDLKNQKQSWFFLLSYEKKKISDFICNNIAMLKDKQ